MRPHPLACTHVLPRAPSVALVQKPHGPGNPRSAPPHYGTGSSYTPPASGVQLCPQPSRLRASLLELGQLQVTPSNIKDACASTPSGTCCARLQVATVGTSTAPFPQVPVGTKMPPLLHPIPLVGAGAAPQRSIPTPQDTYWLSSRSRVKAEPKARTTKLTCARCTPCKRVAAVRHGRLRAPSARRNPIGIVKNHSQV